MLTHQLLKRFVYLNELNPDAGGGGGSAPPPGDPAGATPPTNQPATPPAATPAEPAANAPTTPPAQPAQKWSDSWREDMAGTLAENASDDEKAEHSKLLNRLKRFNSPADAAKALREQDKLISSGALKRALPKNATPEQLAEWRKDNGIPESADKYDLGLPQDLELSDLDHEILNDWSAAMHAANAPPEVVKANTQAYLKMREKVAQGMVERNAEARKTFETELREEWGREYDTNLDGAKNLLANSDSQAVRDLLDLQTPDGVKAANNAGLVRQIASWARTLGYVGATVVPQGGDIGQGIEAELADLNAQMGKDIEAWRKNAKGQARWLQLKEAKQRLDAKK